MDIITWPVVGLVLGLVGMVAFRAPIAALIGRTQKIGKDLVLAAPPQQSGSAANEKNAVDEFMGSYDNQLLRDQEESIRQDLARRGFAGRPDAERVLIRTLAATQILAHFERVYSLIWDSQIGLLRHLNTLSDGSDRNAVAEYYEAVIQRHPQLGQVQDFNSYIGFLESQTLIKQTGGVVTITVAGREFLKWMVETGRSERGVY